MKKRICAVIMCLLLAVNLVGVPKAKAVVSEGALLGSIFGSLLVSMGYSWAADNMDVPGFGEALYKLIQEYDETNKDTGLQLIRDLSLAGLTANGAGKLQFGYAWVQAARSFAEWFESKFFTGVNTTAIISGSPNLLSFYGKTVTVNFPHSVTFKTTSAYGMRYKVYITEPVDFYVHYLKSYDLLPSGEFMYITNFTCDSLSPNNGTLVGSDGDYTVRLVSITQEMIDSNPDGVEVTVSMNLQGDYNNYPAGSTISITPAIYVEYGLSSLTAEKPQEVHYPDVAEDGSQVYEITVNGVTATDIEGIIQGAVDQILAGTAAIAGTVTQAQDVPVTPEAPAAGEYAVPGLETIFPFCIPFDIYAFCSALNADPVAPSFEWRMQYAPLGLDYTFEIDLSAFDGVAQVLRTMELLAFCVGLAFWTRHLIRG